MRQMKTTMKFYFSNPNQNVYHQEINNNKFWKRCKDRTKGTLYTSGSVHLSDYYQNQHRE